MAASKHTHVRAQCSHANVGLAHARPNYTHVCPLYQNEYTNYSNFFKLCILGTPSNSSLTPEVRVHLYSGHIKILTHLTHKLIVSCPTTSQGEMVW